MKIYYCNSLMVVISAKNHIENHEYKNLQIFMENVYNCAFAIFTKVRAILFIPPLPEMANFSTNYFILSKVYTEEGGIKYIYHGLSA